MWLPGYLSAWYRFCLRITTRSPLSMPASIIESPLALRMCFSPLPKMCLGSGMVFLNIFPDAQYQLLGFDSHNTPSLCFERVSFSIDYLYTIFRKIHTHHKSEQSLTQIYLIKDYVVKLSCRYKIPRDLSLYQC